MTFDRDEWRRQWKLDNPDLVAEQLRRDNAARRLSRKAETPEQKEERLAKARAKHKKWRDANPERLKAYNAKHRTENAEGIKKTTRNYSLRTTYGITLEEYQHIFTAQGNCCAVCQNTSRRMHVDHDHTTGRIRGILCHNCNIALGLLQDNEHTLTNLAAYLRANKEWDDDAQTNSKPDADC